MKNNRYQTYQVAIAINHSANIFDYFYDGDIQIGQIVCVELKNKEYLGVVVSKNPSTLDPQKIKAVKSLLQGFILSPKIMLFIDKIAKYTMQPFGSFLKLHLQSTEFYKADSEKFISIINGESRDSLSKKSQEIYDYLCQAGKAPLKDISSKFSKHSMRNLLDKKIIASAEIEATPSDENYEFSLVDLNSDQEKTYHEMKVNKLESHAMLLHGITGSGKTEIYLHFIKDVIERFGGQILILLPEIMLTNELVNRISQRIGRMPLVWHSKISKKEKRQIFQKISHGKKAIIVGARSALFLPYKNLSTIIVDEEHDNSYKQDEGLCYNARDFSVWLAHILDVPIILSSATPSVESYYNARTGKYKYLSLLERHRRISKPTIEILDLKEKRLEKGRFITDELMHAIAKEVSNQKQVVLFLNRKGFAPITICNSCSHNIKCQNCSTNLVYHKRRNRYLCHHCDYSINFTNDCSNCGEKDSLRFCGAGIDKIYEEIKQYFPDKKVISLSSDESQDEIGQKIQDIHDAEADIIIGTQLISKGYHFANVSLVGVIDADIGVLGADLRSGEKMFQIINQVVGRSGRESQGKAIIQTYYPDSAILQSIKNNDIESFYKNELYHRQATNMPPFGKIAAIIISGKNLHQLQLFLDDLKKCIPHQRAVEILGPVESAIYILRQNFRYRFLLKSSSNVNLQQLIKEWLSKVVVPNNIKLKIDVDPYNFL